MNRKLHDALKSLTLNERAEFDAIVATWSTDSIARKSLATAEDTWYDTVAEFGDDSDAAESAHSLFVALGEMYNAR